MSKEELLKYLIAEIDLIMHDKDYRFENQDGTWYSRESCRDLTNEEVLEELRTELRQFDDLEAKLAEKEKTIQAYEKIVEQKDEEIRFANRDKIYIVKQLNDPKDYVLLEDYKKVNSNLKRKIKELKKLKSQKTYIMNFSSKVKEVQVVDDNQDKISFAVEQLEKVKELFESCWDYYFDIGELCNKELFYNKIEQLIAELTHQHEDKGE